MGCFYSRIEQNMQRTSSRLDENGDSAAAQGGGIVEGIRAGRYFLSLVGL
jgi:hypothetical protein